MPPVTQPPHDVTQPTPEKPTTMARIADPTQAQKQHRFARLVLAAINRYLAEHNQAPSPFTWTRSADAILDKLAPILAPSV